MAPRRSTDFGGLGQSGYTAGRHDHDRALETELETQNPSYRSESDEPHGELGTDDRFTGRGGPTRRDVETAT